jgi:hypothetical protein
MKMSVFEYKLVTLTASGKKEKKNILKEVRRKIYAAHQIY